MTPILALVLSAFTTLAPVRVHVDGDGYMRFIRDGRVVYAKQATLTNVGGHLGADGAKLLPAISFPNSVSSISIDLMGNIDAGSSHLGRLVLGIFPAGTSSSGIGSFLSFSDRATLTNPGEDTAGVIRTVATTSQPEDPKPTIKDVIADPKPIAQTARNNQRLNITIAGEGYFQLNGPEGLSCYTRSAPLCVLPSGQIATTSGFLLLPNITIPQGATNLTVSATGNITVLAPGASDPCIIGEIQICTFPHPSELIKLDADLAEGSPKSGSPTVASPGSNGSGLIKFNGSLHGDASELEATRTTPNTIASSTANTAPINHIIGSIGKATPNATGAQIQILVRQHTDMVGKNFTLGDISTVTGPVDLAAAYKKVTIGATAIAGVNRIIDQKYLALKLMGAGFRAGSYVLIVPEGADVARKTVTVSAEDIIAKAVKAAQDKTGMDIPFKSTDPVLPVVAEEGEVSIEASDATLINKNYRVVVTVRQGTTIVSTRTVTLEPPGNLGSIKIGDSVTVLMKSGSAVIEVPGKALSQGFVGQKIQVSIAAIGASTTTQTGTVIESGKVEVDL